MTEALTSSPNKNIPDELTYLIRLTTLTLVITLGLMHRLFTAGARILLPVPALPSLSSLPVYVHWTIYIFCMLCLLWILCTPRNTLPVLGVLFSIVALILLDISRFEPFLIMYCFTIFSAVFIGRKQPEIAINTLRIMVAGVYFWAGFHKLNMTFFVKIFPWFIEPIYTFSKTAPYSFLDYAFVLIVMGTPVFEALIGVLLFLPRWRRLATLMAFTMLVTVLFCLGPLGHNWAMAVWPWNIWLFLMELRLFFDASSEKRPAFSFSLLPMWEKVSAVIFVIAPILAMITTWYTYPGFKLYSGNTATAAFIFAEGETLAKAPLQFKNIIPANHTLDIIDWAVADTEAITYPVAYAYKTTGAGLCPYLDYPSKTILRIYSPPAFYTTHKDYKDVALCP